MITDHYVITAGSSDFVFEFFCEGIYGMIHKRVLFTIFSESYEVYNIGLGDVQPDGTLDDQSRNSSLYSRKVFNTVGLIILRFLEAHPDALVFGTGTTKSRNRLYRLLIYSNLSFIKLKTEVYGFRNGHWEEFVVNKNYDAFIAKFNKSR